MTTYPPLTGRRAVLTGITGQDGSYLAELLLGKGYEVWGMVRRSSSFNTGRIDHLYQDPHATELRLHLVYGDLNDASSLNRILQTVKPHEIYNLGAQSHVKVSFEVPEYTGEVTGLGAIRLLEAMREVGGLCGALLPGLVLGAVRQGGGDPPARDDPVLPPEPLRGGQGLRLPRDPELPRSLRPLRRERDPLQPREPPPRRDVRDP